MDALILGIAGLLTTGGLGALGLYFTAKARRSGMREAVFSRQLDLATEVFKSLGAIRNWSALALEEGHTGAARAELGVAIATFSEQVEVAAAICPVDVYTELADLRGQVTGFAATLDQNGDVAWFPEALAGRSAKSALIMRTYLGIEELSAEGVALLRTAEDLSRLSSLDPSAIAASSSSPGAADSGDDEKA